MKAVTEDWGRENCPFLAKWSAEKNCESYCTLSSSWTTGTMLQCVAEWRALLELDGGFSVILDVAWNSYLHLYPQNSSTK